MSEQENPDPSPFTQQAMQMAERFLDARQIFLWGQVDDQSARHVIERLLYLDAKERGKEITLIINSPGGMNTAGFAIYDVMQGIESPVSTLCFGLAASFGALLLLSGQRGRRFAAPHARIMLHQPWVQGRIEGPATDLRIHANEIMKQRKLIEQIIADRCSRDLSSVEKETDRDRWFTADEAVDFGLIDGVRVELPSPVLMR
jgi:ATP-dependent Clp protease protease subunit